MPSGLYWKSSMFKLRSSACPRICRGREQKLAHAPQSRAMRRTTPPFTYSQSSSGPCVNPLRRSLIGSRWMMQRRHQPGHEVEADRGARAQVGTWPTEAAANDGGGGLGGQTPSMMEHADLGRPKRPRKRRPVRAPRRLPLDRRVCGRRARQGPAVLRGRSGVARPPLQG